MNSLQPVRGKRTQQFLVKSLLVGLLGVTTSFAATAKSGVMTLCGAGNGGGGDGIGDCSTSSFFSDNAKQPTGSLLTQAAASMGVLHAQALATATPTVLEPQISLFTSAGALWFDEFTITAPGVAAGTPGQIEFSFLEHGVLETTGDGQADGGTGAHTYEPSFEFPFIPTDSKRIQNGSARVNRDNNDGKLVFDNLVEGFKGFRFGETFGFQMALALDVGFPRFGADEPSTAEGFFFNTSYWNGFSRVLVQDQNSGDYVEIGNFQIASDSGLDFTQSFVPAVPLPPSLPLFLMGLLGVVIKRARNAC